MSIIADYRHCPKCGELWSFNPDVGRFCCPRCGSMNLGPSLGPNPPVEAKKIMDAVLGKKE